MAKTISAYVRSKLHSGYITVDWNFYHSGKFLGKGDFFRVMWPAWTHAMTVANIQSGFRKTGIFPVNFEAIDKEIFTPSSVTDSKIL